MAEAGGPTIAEVQPKPAGVVDRVKGQLRKLFTPEGRAEAMAQKQIDAIVASQPVELRAKAMELLEARRPDLVAANLPGAKDSLVRDAVIGVAAVGTIAVAGGVAYSQRENIAKKLYQTRVKWYKGLPKAEQDLVGSGIKRVSDAHERAQIWLGHIRKNLSFSWLERKKMNTAAPTPPTS